METTFVAFSFLLFPFSPPSFSCAAVRTVSTDRLSSVSCLTAVRSILAYQRYEFPNLYCLCMEFLAALAADKRAAEPLFEFLQGSAEVQVLAIFPEFTS